MGARSPEGIRVRAHRGTVEDGPEIERGAKQPAVAGLALSGPRRRGDPASAEPSSKRPEEEEGPLGKRERKDPTYPYKPASKRDLLRAGI